MGFRSCFLPASEKSYTNVLKFDGKDGSDTGISGFQDEILLCSPAL